MKIEKLYSIGFDDPGFGIRLLDRGIITGFKTQASANRYLAKNRKRLDKRYLKKQVGHFIKA